MSLLKPINFFLCTENIKIVEILIGSGADLNLGDNNWKTALHLAVSNGSLNVLNANNDAHNQKFILIYLGNEKIVALLIKSGAKLNQKDKYGCTPLMRTGEYGKV